MLKTVKYILLIVLFIYMGLCYAQKVSFVTADLGRHIKNGELFFRQHVVISTNYYSYTESDFPVVTHHWGAGVVYYLIWKWFGFYGLSILNIALYLLAFFFFFRTAQMLSSFKYALFFSVLSIPLVSSRIEIRPEAFSFFFMGAYYYLLCLFRERRISWCRLSAAILPMQFLWVNLHLFFVMGLFLIGAFLAEALIDRKNKQLLKQQYALLAVSAVLVSLVNPYGARGVLEPLMILREYGYMIAENQSVFFMQDRFPGNHLYYHYELMFIWTTVSFILLFFSIGNYKTLSLSAQEGLSHLDKNYLSKSLFALLRKVKQLGPRKSPMPGDKSYSAEAGFSCDKQRNGGNLAEWIIMTGFVVLAWRMIRGIPAFGFFFIPIVSANAWKITQRVSSGLRIIMRRIAVGVTFAAIFAIFLFSERAYSYYSPFNRCLGLGLYPGINRSAEFFKSNNIQGPIFNNYDIGGYLIFHLFPEHKVFVDNRPESYSIPFFKDIYEPMQADEKKWEEMDKRYNFNCIYFYRYDMTPNAQPFLIRRIKDSEWAAVYVDDYAIILVKRNAQNGNLVEQYGLPGYLFNVSSI